MKRLALAIVIAALFPAAAQASWGPNGECTQTQHCYGIAGSFPFPSGHLAIIDHVWPIAVQLPPNSPNAFVTNEAWAGYQGYWIEGGYVMSRGERGCNSNGVCMRIFAAEEAPMTGGYHGHDYQAIGFGFSQYTYFMLYDPCGCGEWEARWLWSPPGPSGSPNGWKFYGPSSGEHGGALGHFNFVPRYEYATAGVEYASNEPIYETGRQSVAQSDGPCNIWRACPEEWLPWEFPTYEAIGPVSVLQNPDFPGAPGAIEWNDNTATLHAAKASRREAAPMAGPGQPGLEVLSGRHGVNVPVPPGAKLPKARYHEIVRNSAGEVTDEYVGKRRLTEEQVKAGS